MASERNGMCLYGNLHWRFFDEQHDQIAVSNDMFMMGGIHSERIKPFFFVGVDELSLLGYPFAIIMI